MSRRNVKPLIKISPDYFVEKDGLIFAGSHLLLDMWGAQNLTQPKKIKKVLCDAALAAGAVVLHAHIHQFEKGGGVSGVVVLAESHISIHTWPEREFVAVDVFMCGSCDPYESIPKIREFFSPKTMNVSEQKRGMS